MEQVEPKLLGLPSELWLKVFHYLDTSMVARFRALNKWFDDLCQEICKGDIRCYLNTMQDIKELRNCINNNLISNTIYALIVSDDLSDYRFDILLKDIHVVNLILDQYCWNVIKTIPHKHLVIRKYISNTLGLCQLPGTLEINSSLPRRDISTLLPKLRNTYTIADYIDATISSRQIINIFTNVPFDTWLANINITESIMSSVIEYLGAEPVGSLYIHRLNPMMCWQHSSYVSSPVTRHVYVYNEFHELFNDIRSLLVMSLRIILDFSLKISKSNMIKVSTVYTVYIEPEYIKDLILMYPLIQTIYRLSSDGLITCYQSNN